MFFTIVAPKSITDNDIYSYSEILYMSKYLQNAGHQVGVSLCKSDELTELAKVTNSDGTIIILQFLNESVLTWLKIFVATCCTKNRVVVYGLAAQTYAKELKETYALEVIPTNSYNSILIYFQTGKPRALPHYPSEFTNPSYDIAVDSGLPVIPIIASRGCMNGCFFCAIACSNSYIQQYKYKNASALSAEIKKYVVENNKSLFYFVDSCFITDDKASYQRAANFAHAIIEAGIRIKFYFETRVDCVCDRDLFVLLKKAGLRRVLLGMENVHPDVIARYNKRITPNQVLQAVSLLDRIGVRVDLSMILFDPLTTVDELIFNLRFIRDNGLFHYVEPYGIFRKLILLPNNRLSYAMNCCETAESAPDVPHWYAHANDYIIKDSTVREFKNAIDRYLPIWEEKVRFELNSLQGIKHKNSYQLQKRGQLVSNVICILENFSFGSSSDSYFTALMHTLL